MTKGARSLLRGLRYRYYPTAKAFQHILLERQARRESTPPILVYQMGKVGSRTILEALRQAEVVPRISHIHFLTAEGVQREEDAYRKGWTRDGRAAHLWRSQHLRRRLARRPTGETWDVVTLVRDPVARNVSSFFQTGARDFPLEFERHAGDEDEASTRELTRLFLERFEGHDVPLAWLDDELKAVFGIDVYAVPFSPERGYRIYENERARVLLIRLESLRSCAPTALRDFLGLESVTLGRANVAEDKDYARAYRRFVEGVRIPPEYLSRMYGSRYARHFYSQEELDAFRRRWERPAEPAELPRQGTTADRLTG